MQHSDFLPASRPILVDLASCDRWLERERFTDSDRACAAFIELLDQLEDAPPSAQICTRIMERLRTPMQVALEEQSRRYSGKPLPLALAEAAAFERGCDLWLAQVRAWRRLLRAAWNKPDRAPDRPRLALRTLESIAGLLTACFAARLQIAPKYWRWLNQAYEFAEKEGLVEQEVSGEQSGGGLTCNVIYTRLLLLQLANPAALSQREFEWTKRWANRWTRKVRLWRPAANGGGLAVDLASETGAQCIAAGTPSDALLFLDCAGLRRSMRSRLEKLGAGSSPEELGLGRDCPPFAGRQLLSALLHCWSDAPKSRQFPRRSTTGNTELVVGFAGIHQTIAGDAFDDDTSPWSYTRQQVEQIHLFHRIATALSSQKPESRIERWETLDESANGFRLRRGVEGVRLAHRQLVALRPRGASQFILCDIRWLLQSGHESGEDKPGGENTGGEASIGIGAKAMPGLPQACALRSVAGTPTNGGAWTQAFVLPLPSALAPNLVVPIGWYQPGRELDLKLQNEQFRVRLDELLERGHDYQRVSFSAIGMGAGV